MKMKRLLFFSVSLLVIFPLTTLTLLYASIPKSVVLDRLLQRGDVHLLPGSVEEDLFKVVFGNVEVFLNRNKVAEFSSLTLSIRFSGVEVNSRCRDGSGLTVKLSPRGYISARFKEVSCIELVDHVSGSVKLVDDKLSGSLTLKGLKHNLFTVDLIDLNFKGREFTGRIMYQGMELGGSGTVKLDTKDPLNTEIRGRFEGAGLKLNVAGTLRDLRIR